MKLDKAKAERVLVYLASRMDEASFKSLPAPAKKAFFAKLGSGKVKGGKVYPKNKAGNRTKPKYGKYHKDFENGEKLLQQVSSGGELKLASWDGELRVDVKVEPFAGMYNVATKQPGADYGTPREYNRNGVINYLAQFRKR